MNVLLSNQNSKSYIKFFLSLFLLDILINTIQKTLIYRNNKKHLLQKKKNYKNN